MGKLLLAGRDGLANRISRQSILHINIEERDGLMDVIIPAQIFIEFRDALSAAFVIVEGTLQSKGVTTAIVASKVRRLD